MSTRSILGMVFTLEALKSGDLDIDPVLQRYGLDLQRLSPEAEIERTLEIRIYNQIIAGAANPLLGLEIGKKMSLAGYGPFIMLLMTCPTAWDALRTGIRYQNLTYLFGDLSLVPGNSCTQLCIKPIPLPANCRRVLIDRDVSGTYQFLSDIQSNLGTDIKPTAIRLPYPKPAEYRDYEEFFQCPVEFDHSCSAIQINNEALAIRFPGASRMAHELYRNQCEQALEQRARRERNGREILEQVGNFLSLFVERYPSVGEVAFTLDMSERSLRRKLTDAGTSFRQILDDVRDRKACELLTQTNQPIEHIAQQLGYAESAAFIHAFQRWRKQSPTAFRTQQRRPDQGASPQ